VTARPAAFHSLRRGQFPLVIEILDAATRTLRWSVRVPGPGAIAIPAASEVNGGAPVAVRVTFGDGSVITEEPPGQAR
jgi:hypothetical protein